MKAEVDAELEKKMNSLRDIKAKVAELDKRLKESIQKEENLKN